MLSVSLNFSHFYTGPVTTTINGHEYQIGVVSWGAYGCVKKGASSVLARVTSLVDTLGEWLGDDFDFGNTTLFLG